MRPVNQISSTTITLVVIVLLFSSFIGSRLGEVIMNRSQTAAITQPPSVVNLYYVSPNGNDANPGTFALPWRTLTKAGVTARAGDTVYIRAGTYTQTLTPVFSGTAGNPITFKAYPGDECKGVYGGPKTDCRVIIDGQDTRINGIDSDPHSYIRIEGLEIKNHKDDGINVQYSIEAELVSGIEIVNNYIHNNGHFNTSPLTDDCDGAGVWAKNVKSSLFENNEFFSNGMSAIDIGGDRHSENVTIKSNYIHYNGVDGVHGGGSGLVIENNRIFNQFHTTCHQDGLDLGYSDGVVIKNNVIYDLTQLIYLHNQGTGPLRPIKNVQIYGNVGYTDRYAIEDNGDAPAMNIDAHFNVTLVRDINIHSNTFGWTGATSFIHDDTHRSPISNINVYNNIFVGKRLEVDTQSTNVYSDYNIYFNTLKPEYEGSHSVEGDPHFQNYQQHVSWNYRLTPQSTLAINMGSLGGITVPPQFKDMDNVSRPQSSTFDIGAYEYVGTTPPIPGGPNTSYPCSPTVDPSGGAGSKTGGLQTHILLPSCAQ